MGRTPDYKKKFGELMHQLSREYPTFGIGRHLSMALSDYGDFWGISDKELCFAIEKYQAELALDEQQLVPDDYIKEIEEDAKHLFDEKSEDEEEEY